MIDDGAPLTPVAPRQVLGRDDVRRATVRMAHEIVERNPTLSDPDGDRVVLVGVQRGGVWLAEALAGIIVGIADGGAQVPWGSVDVSLFRDDIGLRPVSPSSVSDLPDDLDGALVVIVDDVLYTGRTVRAAFDAIGEYGRPRAMQLAVLVDRGHRELPIRPDYVGKNLPTSTTETVTVDEDGVTIS